MCDVDLGEETFIELDPYKMKFIAEISSNHLQSLKRIKKFIKTSKYLGCYAVKFQLFKVENFLDPQK